MHPLTVIHLNGPINSGKTTIGMALARLLPDARLFVVTLAPPEAAAASNRGARALTDWERQRIAEMYREGYAARRFSDCVIDTSGTSVDACAREIARRLQ